MVCNKWVLGGLCPSCVATFAPGCGSGTAAPSRCLGCGLRLHDSLQHGAALRCGRCLTTPIAVDRVCVALDYGPPWDRHILRLKFHRQPELARPLAQLLAQAVATQGLGEGERCAALQGHPSSASAPLYVAPIPLSSTRLRDRGYNQAWELARRVATAQRLPAVPNLLMRWRETPAQARLSAAERHANLQDAFSVPPEALQRVHGSHVVLVDDVMTTGATLHAAAQALRRVGARNVSAWVLARTPEAH